MRALVLLLSFVVVGCMLVVSPDTYGDRCRFAGDDTSQCGLCVASRCRAEVDACCRDGACDATMRALDGCSDKHDGNCATLASSNTDLGRCVAAKCAAVCVTLTGTSATTCREPHLGEGSVCTCDGASTAGNDFICSQAAYPDTICCAPPGWPAPGLACSCTPLSCTPTADGCFCALADFTPPKSRECSGGPTSTCCADHDKCTCRARASCYAGEHPVPSCEIRNVGCKENQQRVDSCSARL